MKQTVILTVATGISLHSLTPSQQEKGTPVDGREFVKGKRDEVEQQYWNQSFSYGKNRARFYLR